MLIGIHSRDNDLEVNVLKGKKLTNIRAAGKDEAVKLTPPIKMTLERALSWIQDDELVEVTPKSIRLRKLYLDPNERKRFEKKQVVECCITSPTAYKKTALSGAVFVEYSLCTDRTWGIHHDSLPMSGVCNAGKCCLQDRHVHHQPRRNL